jgi:hypothetical protein
MKAPISTSVAIVVGLLVLLGYFFPIPVLANLRAVILQVALILAGFALIAGVINLASVHWAKVSRGEPGSAYSLVLLVSLVLTTVLVGYFAPNHPVSVWIFTNVQAPLEASLVALLAVVLLYAGVRLFRRRPDALSLIFLITAVLVLLGSVPFVLFPNTQLLSSIRSYLVEVVSVGGARGILIGVALGTLATGVRVLVGADRPYSG